MNVKICGITTMKQLIQLDGLDIDFAGIVFDKKSYQYAGDKLSAKEIKSTDFDIKKVGVFADAEYDEILETADSFNLDLVQLQGDESPELCRLISKEIEVIKTFYLPKSAQLDLDAILTPYDDACDYYSFDSDHLAKDTGLAKSIDLNLIRRSKIEKPFFLGGNSIKPSDATVIHQFRHPDFYGVDLNFNFEKTPGVKDMGLVLTFIQALKQVAN